LTMTTNACTCYHPLFVVTRPETRPQCAAALQTCQNRLTGATCG
jgi:hypothetical protein